MKLIINILFFLLITNQIIAKENQMILKLKDGEVKIELFQDVAPNHVERIKTLANNFTEFKYLPKGEFFIDSLNAQLQHYPHKLHDFQADILIDDADINIVDFIGYVDDSDFNITGLAHNYGFWFQNTLNGDVDVDITLKSKLLKLEDIFSYKAQSISEALSIRLERTQPAFKPTSTSRLEFDEFGAPITSKVFVLEAISFTADCLFVVA